MLKLSKNALFILFIVTATLFGITLTIQIKEFKIDEGNFFNQFSLSLLGLSLTLFMMCHYIKSLKK